VTTHDSTALPFARWRDNSGVLRLVGIGPLLVVTTSLVNAIVLGLATLAVLTASSLLVSLLRRSTGTLLRLPLLLSVIATLAAAADLLLQGWSYPLYQSLGLFVPLIAANSLLLTHADANASSQTPLAATTAALRTGLGYLALLFVVGAVRELLGTGALFADMQQLFPFADSWHWQVFETATPFLLALTPPGALLLLTLLVALHNLYTHKFASPMNNPTTEPGSKRIRVTGKP
jgi:electron transport complex protein RnfE